MIPLDPTSGLPFWRQIEAALAERIRTGELAPGALLPSVRGLAQELLVSVITVKQAYAALEAAGLVRSHQGRGTWVTDAGADAARAKVRATLRERVEAAVAQARAEGMGDDELRAELLALLEGR